jgi:hypothetical protein
MHIGLLHETHCRAVFLVIFPGADGMSLSGDGSISHNFMIIFKFDARFASVSLSHVKPHQLKA